MEPEKKKKFKYWIISLVVIIVVLLITNYFVGFPIYTIKYIFAADSFEDINVKYCHRQAICKVKIGEKFVMHPLFYSVEENMSGPFGGVVSNTKNEEFDDNYLFEADKVSIKGGGGLNPISRYLIGGLMKYTVFEAKKIGTTQMPHEYCDLTGCTDQSATIIISE